MAATTDTSRSALHWALQELAGYVLAALGGVLAFTIWAVVYTYVWPGKPPASIEAPTPPATTPIDAPAVSAPPVGLEPPLISSGPVVPDPSTAMRLKKLPNEAISQIPSDVLPSLRNMDIYDPSDAKVGQIKDVLVSYDGTLVGFIVDVSGWKKDIAVPSQAVGFTMKGGSTFPVLYMTKDAVKNAPKQKFDDYKMKWVLDTAP
jgi:PRC-barrel domain